MAPIYFGFTPSNRKDTKRSVRTPSGDLEPIEPSRIKVFANTYFSPSFAMISYLLGLAISVFSYPVGFFVHTSADGLVVKSATESLPFETPGLAIAIRKGKSPSSNNIALLESASFTTMEMAGNKIWLKERATRADYLLAATLDDVDNRAKIPGRYLSVDSFREFLLLRSLTTRIFEFFHFLTETGAHFPTAVQRSNSTSEKEWVNARSGKDDDTPVVSGTFEFKKSFVFAMTQKCDANIGKVLRIEGAKGGTAVENSGALVSPSVNRPKGCLFTSDLGANITSHGLLFKFNHQLASSDVNLIGDIIGRYFLKSLGDDLEDQFEALASMKSGLSALRLTRVGDELTHLYKCLEIAILCHAGCVPIFSRGIYEGALVSGGPGATILIGGNTYPFRSVESLKADYLNFSEHDIHLQAILRIAPMPLPTEEGETVTIPETMVELRRHLLTAKVSASQRAEIERRSAHLSFNNSDPWVISPSNLSKAFILMSDLVNQLDNSHPIGRLALFSTDPVLVSLSCFGEKTCPSWDIPAGTKCSLKKPNPPNPPQTKREKGSSGTISDAAWVMVIMTVDLMTSVKEFTEMASTLTYRSISSNQAKNIGYRSFGRDRMAEFWGVMREAMRTINPNAAYEEEDVEEPEKRKRDSDGDGVSGGKKKRRMEV